MKEKAKQTAELIRGAKSMIAFTGAGASVSAGIGTYRGTEGIDTLDELGQNSNSEEESDPDYEGLKPTLTHKALVALEEKNLIAVITQNCDDLHAKAGTKDNILFELHGNVFVEYCEKCLKTYKRDYCVDLYSTNCYLEKWFVKCKRCGLGHYTGRKCTEPKCTGKLKDTIVNFGDYLHETVGGGLENAMKLCEGADLSLSLGSSLTVPPASKLPLMAKSKVICNLQKTESDKEATIRVFYPCDTFLSLVLKELNMKLPE